MVGWQLHNAWWLWWHGIVGDEGIGEANGDDGKVQPILVVVATTTRCG